MRDTGQLPSAQVSYSRVPNPSIFLCVKQFRSYQNFKKTALAIFCFPSFDLPLQNLPDPNLYAWINYYGINTEYIVFRDGSGAIGMFRAITEINVLVQLRSDPLITQGSCTFHGSHVVSQNSSRYENRGFESCSSQLFFISFFFVFMSRKCT